MAMSNLSANEEMSRRYAAALFELALEDGVLAEIGAALQDIVDLFAASDELAMVMRSPVVATTDKEQALIDICGLRSAPELLCRFVAITARDNKAGSLPAIAAAWNERMDEHLGVREVKVSTALPADEARQVEIDSLLSSALESKIRIVNKIRIVYETDPELIGGVQIRIGSHLIDASLRSALERIGRNLKGI